MIVTPDLVNDPYALSSLMDFDHVIRVLPDGTVETEVPDVWAPSVQGQGIDDPIVEGDWTLMSGFTGQYAYNGPVMHSSEYIGGNMARQILAAPGLYVAVIVEGHDDEEDPDGWAVATIAD